MVTIIGRRWLLTNAAVTTQCGLKEIAANQENRWVVVTRQKPRKVNSGKFSQWKTLTPEILSAHHRCVGQHRRGSYTSTCQPMGASCIGGMHAEIESFEVADQFGYRLNHQSAENEAISIDIAVIHSNLPRTISAFWPKEYNRPMSLTVVTRWN